MAELLAELRDVRVHFPVREGLLLPRETGRVRAEGKVVSIGKPVAFAEARITDEAGRLYASATSTLLVFERKP